MFTSNRFEGEQSRSILWEQPHRTAIGDPVLVQVEMTTGCDDGRPYAMYWLRTERDAVVRYHRLWGTGIVIASREVPAPAAIEARRTLRYLQFAADGPSRRP